MAAFAPRGGRIGVGIGYLEGVFLCVLFCCLIWRFFRSGVGEGYLGKSSPH